MVLGMRDESWAEVMVDHAPAADAVLVSQLLPLDASERGDAEPEVQWQWFEVQWWSFSPAESTILESARADPSQTTTELTVHGTRYLVDFRSMCQRNAATGEERPIRRATTCDLWRELAPEGERAEGERQELRSLLSANGVEGAAPEPEAELDPAVSRGGGVEGLPTRLAVRVRCEFGGFSMAGAAGQRLVSHGQEPPAPLFKHVAMGELPSDMTMFQCLMKATDMLDVLSEDGGRAPSRTLVPWQCSFSVSYTLEVIDAATGEPLQRRSPQPGGTASAATQVVVVYENQRCPWVPFGDPRPDKFSEAALLRNDRNGWSDLSGTALPAPSTEPLPPAGWEWRGEWYVASEWEYAYDWGAEWSAAPTPKSWVRRRRWERQLEDLSTPAPPSPPPPVESSKPQPIPGASGAEMVRNLQEQGSSPFITRWGLEGSPDTIASRMGTDGKRLQQAMRDLQGDSFVLDAPFSPPERGALAASPEGTEDKQTEDDDEDGVLAPPPPARSNGANSAGLHRRVFSILNLQEASLSAAERAAEAEAERWERALRGSPQPFKDALRLLAQLHRDPLLRNACPADCWLSSKLGYKLRDQLSDPLTLVSGALPEWCECLMFGARFLYPFDLRQLYFRCTAFGPARAVAWLKQQQPRAFDPVGALKVTPRPLADDLSRWAAFSDRWRCVAGGSLAHLARQLPRAGVHADVAPRQAQDRASGRVRGTARVRHRLRGSRLLLHGRRGAARVLR